MNRLDIVKPLFPGNPFQYQLDWINDTSKYKLAIKARQIGITTAEANDRFVECALWTASDKNPHPPVIVFSSPSQRQSSRLMNYIQRARSRFERKFKTKLTFKKEREDHLYFDNFAEIWSLPNNPRTIEGIDASRGIIDEIGNFTGREDQEVYQALTGSLGAKGGGMTIFGRPRGRRGLFWQLVDPYGPFSKEYSIHTFKWGVRAKEDPIYKETVTEQIKILPPLAFQEQYECLPPKTPIITDCGIKNICDIKIGDLVLTHKGRFKKVIFVNERKYKGDLTKIKTFKSTLPISLTPNHPVLVCKKKMINYPKRKIILEEPEWLEAGEITKDYTIAYPINKTVKDKEHIKTKEYMRNLPHGSKWMLYKKDKILVDERLMRIIGYYLAEGSVGADGRCIQFSFGHNESELSYAHKLLKDIKSLFGVIGKIRRHEYGIAVYINSVNIAELLIKLCGKGAKNKKLESWILKLPIEKQKHLVDAFWEGDGCRTKTQNRTAIISKELIFQLKDILIRMGHNPAITHTKKQKEYIMGRKCKVNDLYGLVYYNKLTNSNRGLRSFRDEDYIYLSIKNIEQEKYIGLVYNLQVEDDESFCAIYHTVHNCEFVDEGIVVYPWELLDRSTNNALGLWTPQSTLDTEYPLYMGIDFGKKVNRTSIKIVENREDKVRLRYTHSTQASFPDQLDLIVGLIENFKIVRVVPDETGQGLPMLDFLVKQFGESRIIGFNFSNLKLLEKMIMDFLNLLTENKFEMPSSQISEIKTLMEQLHGVEKEVLQSGRAKYTGKRTETDWEDDDAWSLILACSQLGQAAWDMTIAEVGKSGEISEFDQFAKDIDEYGNPL